MLQHMDNFSIYGTDTAFMRDGIYAEVGGMSGPPGDIYLTSDPDGISSGRVLFMGGGAGGGGNFQRVRYALQTAAQPILGAAMRIWLPSLTNAGDKIVCPFSWRNVSNAALFSITVDTTGRLEFRSGDQFGAVLFTTTAPVITASAWFHVEAKLTIAGVAGNIEIRVEGIPVMNETINSGAVNIAQFSIINDPDATSAGTPYYVKDFVLWDGSGSYNNDFLGSVLVKSLVPDSDVALNWATTGPNGFSVLDNIPPDNAAYITAINPPPAPYEATLTNLPPDVTSVKGIMTFVRAAKTDGGDGSLQVSMVSNVSTANGTNRPITVAQTYWRDIFETDPNTALPWLPNAVDLAQIKINRTL